MPVIRRDLIIKGFIFPEVGKSYNISVFSNSGSDIGHPDFDLGNVNIGWLANLWRNIKLVTIRDPLKKAELQLEKANMRLLKLKHQVENNADDQELQNKFDQAYQKFTTAMEQVQNRVEEMNQNNQDNLFGDFPYSLNEIALQKVDSTMITIHVYIDGEFVGGCDVLTEMHNNGELKNLLQKN